MQGESGRACERLEPGSLVRIERRGDVRASFQDPPDRAGHDRARTVLDEDADSVPIRPLDRLRKVDRLQRLLRDRGRRRFPRRLGRAVSVRKPSGL